jgi:hypothetical protein
LALALGCRQDVPALFQRNQRPETTLTIIPEDSTLGLYRYHVYWRGEDPDGRVLRYIFAITDTLSRNEEENWDPTLAEDIEHSFYTEKTDSIFVFNSSLGHAAFHISAIDDFGDKDRTPARAFFKVKDNGLPKVQFLDVRSPALSEPCTAELCTIPNYTPFKIRFTGTTSNGAVTGYQWQSQRPARGPRTQPPEPFQPLGVDSLFWDADLETTLVDFRGDTLWSLRQGIVTVYYNITRDDSLTGNFSFRARVRDQATQTSLLAEGFKRVVINHDPETQLYRMPRCDCPNAPQPCSATDSVRAGFLTGIDATPWPVEDWVPFCEGDTLPTAAHVRFFVKGVDDSLDVPETPGGGLKDVSYSYWYYYTAPGGLGQLTMPASRAYAPTTVALPPVVGGGGDYRGMIGWDADHGLCPFDYTFFAAAVDEQDKLDGTPDFMSFHVSHTPTIDRFLVDSLRTLDPITLKRPPLTVVFIPKCRATFPQFCPPAGVTFGPDTIAVYGVNIPPANPATILQGQNDFLFPFDALGHDSPRDRDTYRGIPIASYYGDNIAGRIRAWIYNFACQAPPGEVCDDLGLLGENDWRTELKQGDDPVDAEVFDEPLLVRMNLDTLCTAAPCTPASIRIGLPSAKLGRHLLTVRGRDSDAIGQICNEPTSLDSTVLANRSLGPTQVSEQGRPTEIDSLVVNWVQYGDVRPWVSRQPAKQKTGFWQALLRKKVSR